MLPLAKLSVHEVKDYWLHAKHKINTNDQGVIASHGNKKLCKIKWIRREFWDHYQDELARAECAETRRGETPGFLNYTKHDHKSNKMLIPSATSFFPPPHQDAKIKVVLTATNCFVCFRPAGRINPQLGLPFPTMKRFRNDIIHSNPKHNLLFR